MSRFRESPQARTGSQSPLPPSRSYLSGHTGSPEPALRPGNGNRQNMQAEQVRTPLRSGPGSPGKMKGAGNGANYDRVDVNSEFEKLLDHYQVPATVRAKLTPLDTPVKESMLRSSQQPRLQGMRTQSFFPSSPSSARTNPSTPQLRKTRSGSSLGSPGTPIRGSDSIPESRSWRSTEMVDDNKFVMIPTNTKVVKRLTQDGLPMPPPLPGDAFPDEVVQDSRRNKRHSFDLAGMRERAGSLANSSFSSKGSIFAKSKSSKAPGTSTSSSSILVNKAAESQGARKRSQSKSDGHPGAVVTRKESPVQWANWLASENTFQMDVGKTKRLRMLLRHETTDWVAEFLQNRGYESMIARLKDLLNVEWREEQHDDQLLNELLRCIKAVETAEIGRETMRSFGTTPFRELADLLYSSKKPGDIVTRRFIVEIMQSLLQIYAEESMPLLITSSTSRPGSRPTTISFSDQSKPVLRHIGSRPNLRSNPQNSYSSTENVPDNHAHIALYLATLLKHEPETKSLVDIFQQPAHNRTGSRILCPATELPAPQLDVHDFLKQAHKDRIYKHYLTEINEVCRDFFWVMCHSENSLWELAEVDQTKIKPQAPTGASGGVEFEAMGYLTTHFQLLNALVKSLFEYDLRDPAVRKDEKKGEAWKFFQDMNASGLDRTLITVRKASVDYYPHFHLEVARFIRLWIDVGAELPYPVKRILGPPGSQYRKRVENNGEWSSYSAYETAARGGASGFLEAANENMIRLKEWDKPTAGGDYDFQL